VAISKKNSQNIAILRVKPAKLISYFKKTTIHFFISKIIGVIEQNFRYYLTNFQILSLRGA